MTGSLVTACQPWPVSANDLLRLDSLVNPFAPSPLARALPGTERDRSDLAVRLRASIAERLDLSVTVVELGATAESLLASLSSSPAGNVRQSGEQIGPVLTLIASPDLETGRMLTITESVRLARTSQMLVIDERAGGFSHRDHLPLFREFEHVVLLRSFDPWIEPAGGRLSYLLTKRRPACPALPPHESSLALSLATEADQAYVRSATRRVVRERLRLWRALRKLNMVRPLPGAASFVAAIIERGDRTSLQSFLEGRGIQVNYPESPGNQDLIRISAVSPSATAALSAALVDWANELDCSPDRSLVR